MSRETGERIAVFYGGMPFHRTEEEKKETMNNTHASRTRYLVELALMVTIIFVMAFTPLGYFRTLGLSITFLDVPVAGWAMILGPLGGAICGLAFGITSLCSASVWVLSEPCYSASIRWEPQWYVSFRDSWKDGSQD